MNLDQTEFDYIILGTGLTESILAAAIAKTGKSVLHVDDADYYGGKWAAHSFGDLLKWIRTQRLDGDIANKETNDAPPSLNGLSIDGKHAVNVNALKARNESIRHVSFFCYPTESDNITEDDKSTLYSDTNILLDMNRESPLDYARDTIVKALSDRFTNPSKITKEAIEFEVDQLVLGFPPTSSFSLDIKDSIGRVQTLKEALDASRHYNFDLSPKLLSCRGEMVEVLIKSGIGRYLEFKGLEESYVFEAESQTFDKVPISKEDVFSTDTIALIDKRKLMRFLTLAMSDEIDPSILETYGNQPFKTMLEEKFKINGKLQMAIIYAIALVHDDAEKVSASEGLEKTRAYLKSLGRFGRCAFLRPLYGGASEVAQAFCRACAVHGGIYMLNQPVDKFLLNEDRSQASGIVTRDGQQFTSKWIIGSMEYMNEEWISKQAEEESTRWTSRAILITNEPPIISEGSEKENIRFSVFPPSEQDDIAKPIFALQLSIESMSCPRNKYMTYLSVISDEPERDAKSELEKAVEKLIKNSEHIQPLFLLYYKQRSQESSLIATDSIPKNIIACSDPDELLDLDEPLSEAQKVFIRCCGEDEEFLPAPEVDPDLEE
ncbi:hypothetical protein K450DRAFT_245097 [Umbelopsis ramanniana AG]|uniref:Rab escort protein 1 n=1 Tax=Umbelopsis ramanniana AG TaxID=1314678 RepID=A0AAD5HDV1_UMBRA|nr:uncharacterized protein K450DRAFT_245097 [Umbelopsis ramanniana AG]KAI8578911.1 hypothetical protein K450DRAFT_245097 [Umbelopsis ramanniana AG]